MKVSPPLSWKRVVKRSGASHGKRPNTAADRVASTTTMAKTPSTAAPAGTAGPTFRISQYAERTAKSDAATRMKTGKTPRSPDWKATAAAKAAAALNVSVAATGILSSAQVKPPTRATSAATAYPVDEAPASR